MRRPSTQNYHENIPAIVEKLHAIGREVISVHADDVDKKARFPVESINALKAEKLLSCYVPV